ncbi:hypothetical protein, partial [Bradyrhizobium liaoningense]|uniref:hypothetical protein n=1 Tax=Bradyrhizobium liaoningense TaxID=43992 RepID=UPI0024E07707
MFERAERLVPADMAVQDSGAVVSRDPLVDEAVSYAGFWVTRRSGGVVFRHLDDLDAVFESDTCADLRQL